MIEENLYYESTDDVKLCGLLSIMNDTKKILVLCHGLNGDKTERNSFNKFTEKLQKQKINSFRFDFRGHGESSGNDYEMTPTKEVEDLEETIKMLNNRGFNEIVVNIRKLLAQTYKDLYNKETEIKKVHACISFTKRVYEFLDDIKEKYKDKTLLLVTHSGVTKVINCYFNGVPNDGNLQLLGLKNCEVKMYKL